MLGGDGASSHLIVQKKKKATILYLQFFWKFEIKLFKNNFKVSHTYTNYITFCLIDKNKFCYNTYFENLLQNKICCTFVATQLIYLGTVAAYTGMSGLLSHNFAHEEHPGNRHTRAHNSALTSHIDQRAQFTRWASHTHLSLQLSILLQRTLCPPTHNSQVTDCLSF